MRKPRVRGQQPSWTGLSLHRHPLKRGLKCTTTLCEAQCWLWNLSRRLSQLLHSQLRGICKVYERNGTCLTLGEGLKPPSLGKLRALEGSSWRKEASAVSERCDSGKSCTGSFMSSYPYKLVKEMCNLEPQGSVHLRSSLYEPKKHFTFLHQILAKVKKSKSAWDLCGGFIPLKDLFLVKSRWHRREYFFLNFLLKAQLESLKMSLHPYLALANKSTPDCTENNLTQPHALAQPYFFRILRASVIVQPSFVSIASPSPNPKVLQCAVTATLAHLGQGCISTVIMSLLISSSAA